MKKILFYPCVALVAFAFILSCNNIKKGTDDDPQVLGRTVVKTVNGVSFKMIKVDAVKKATLAKNTGKEREVTLSAFYIGETEVTQELYKAVTGKEPSHFNGINQNTELADGEIQEKRPVEMVNWYEAALFCNALTEKLIDKQECVYTIEEIEENQGVITGAKVSWDFSKKGFRLPTEAEFEYAARGGEEDAVYAGGDARYGDPADTSKSNLGEVAWFNENANKVTHQVMQKKPNGYGIYDMSGNVIEWCHDYYLNPLPDNVSVDPEGPLEDPTGAHTTKGGGYGLGGYSACVVSARTSLTSYAQLDDTGFRLVCRF